MSLSLGNAALILDAAAASLTVGVTPSAKVVTVWTLTVLPFGAIAVMSTYVPPIAPDPRINSSEPTPPPGRSGKLGIIGTIIGQ